MDEVQVLNGTLRVGDRVAVAVKGRNSTMKIGEVLEIMPGIAGYNGGYGHTRVKVRVDKTGDFTGRHYNPETRSWEFRPYVKVYDCPMSMVKLGALQDAL